jgi:fatty-acyl-CoA synthase
MIVSGGENVFPKEVEDVLTGHDAVSEAAAVGVEDEKFGQRLKAFVVLSEGQKVSEDELKDLVKSNLARYKVPREIEFIDELPRNPTGKVLKRKLAEGESEDEDGEGKSDEGEGAEEEGAEARSEDGAEGSEERADEGSTQAEDEARTEA